MMGTVTGNDLPLATIVAAFIALGATIAAAWISHATRIARFRQRWINDLRKDMALCLAKIKKWAEFYITEINPDSKVEIATAVWDPPKRKNLEENVYKDKKELWKEQDKMFFEYLGIIRRIELRFKPDEKADKDEKKIIKGLAMLHDPKWFIRLHKYHPEEGVKKWGEMADLIANITRRYLKVEWEKAKKEWKKIFVPLVLIGALILILILVVVLCLAWDVLEIKLGHALVLVMAGIGVGMALGVVLNERA